MCWINCRETSEPSDIPSRTSTDWVRIGGTASARPARAAIPTAIIAPEISPPGRFAHKNSSPPALPTASVSTALRTMARLVMADAIDVGIRVTPPYGKSARYGQMRHAIAAMRRQTDCRWDISLTPQRRIREIACSLRLVGRRLLAFRKEFLAFLAVQSLGVGFLRAFERARRPRLGFLLLGRRLGVGLRSFGLGRGRGLRECTAHQQKRSERGCGGKGRNLHHGGTS